MAEERARIGPYRRNSWIDQRAALGGKPEEQDGEGRP